MTRAPFNKPSPIPKGFGWDKLVKLDGDDLEIHYRHTLEELGRRTGMLGTIFRKAQNKIQDPAKLRRLIVDLIDKETWTMLDADVKGDAYEGLLEKNAADVEGGAGQYFTPRALISAVVEVMAPKPGLTICDPACGTGGFLLAAHDYLAKSPGLDRAQKKALKIVAQWCVTQEAEIVSVDAPCRWRADGGDARLVERELAAERISCFSTPTEAKARGHTFYTWMCAGQKLYAALDSHYPVYTGDDRINRVAIETFPQAVACALAGVIVSAKRKFAVRGDLLRRSGIDASGLKSIDEVDAAMCAIAASAFVSGSFKSYGDSLGGFIIVPKRPAATDKLDRAVSEAGASAFTPRAPATRWTVPKWIPHLKATDCGDRVTRSARTMLREGGRCIYCGLDLVTNTELLLSAEFDHLVPQAVFRDAAEGGYTKTGDYLTNLVFCCGPCNDAKDNWPLCAKEPDRTMLLTSASREEYLAAARKFILPRRRSAEKRVAQLMAKVWAQRASKLTRAMS